MIYNNPQIISLMVKYKQIGLSEAELDVARHELSVSSNLISYERLVDWNPRNWEMSAEENLKFFGAQSHIVITIRDTLSYHTSVYQQSVHEGNVKSAEDFFLSSVQYNALSTQLALKSRNYYDVDSFDLERLAKLYMKRFERVSIVPLELIHELKFLKDHFDLDYNEISYLKKSFKEAPRLNMAYSALAMRLTFKREAFLRSFQLASIGSHNELVPSLLRDRDRGGDNQELEVAYCDLSISQKILQFPFRLAKNILRPLQIPWRYLMQNTVNNHLPNKKYQLPTQCYRNKELEEKNTAFYERVKSGVNQL